jgi:two-component system response regulator GlrR
MDSSMSHAGSRVGTGGRSATDRRRVAGQHPALENLIGKNPAFVREIAKIPRIASCDCKVLITGETGTGKELFAQAIHYLSPRADHPFVAVNCGALPSELVESEFFGHVRGAYTSAQGAREGLFAEAEGGTLLLDDVDCLPIAAQSTFLRVLQEGEYRQVGSNTLRRSDVRVIAASNRHLPELCARAEFRQDLYYRLNTVRLALPPLRERREDIALFAMHFLRTYASDRGNGVIALSPEALCKLATHDWPGNVRELQHVLERAALMSDGETLGSDAIEFDDSVEHDEVLESFAAGKARVIAQYERHYIEQILESSAGNVTHAARAARKNRRAFFALMKKHDIEAGQFRRAPDA